MNRVTARKINQARERGGRVIAVGTTVVRALESAADERRQPNRGARLHPFIDPTSISIARPSMNFVNRPARAGGEPSRFTERVSVAPKKFASPTTKQSRENISGTNSAI